MDRCSKVKGLLAVLLVIVLAGCGTAASGNGVTPTVEPPVPAVVDWNAVYLDSYRAVYRIESDDGGRGTAWLVRPGVLVTAAHVVRGVDVVTVRPSEEPAFSAVVTKMDENRDLAVLEFEAHLTSARPLVIGVLTYPTDIAKGVLALGYSGNIGKRANGSVGSVPANYGIISQLIGETRQGKQIIMDAPIDKGDSGGPVLNEYGRVIGVIRTTGVATGDNVNLGMFFATQADEVEKLLAP